MAFPSSKKKSAPPFSSSDRSDGSGGGDNYNNEAMDLLNSPSDVGDAGMKTSPLPPSPADTAGAGGIQISKVPGGYQVSTVVSTIEEAHAISQQFLGGEMSPEEAMGGDKGMGGEGIDSDMGPSDKGDGGGPVEA